MKAIIPLLAVILLSGGCMGLQHQGSGLDVSIPAGWSEGPDVSADIGSHTFMLLSKDGSGIVQISKIGDSAVVEDIVRILESEGVDYEQESVTIGGKDYSRLKFEYNDEDMGDVVIDTHFLDFEGSSYSISLISKAPKYAANAVAPKSIMETMKIGEAHEPVEPEPGLRLADQPGGGGQDMTLIFVIVAVVVVIVVIVLLMKMRKPKAPVAIAAPKPTDSMAAPPMPAAPKPTTTGATKCANCGTEVPAGSMFCFNCGRKV